MKHDNLKMALKEANELWELYKVQKNDPSNRYRDGFVLGCLQARYEMMYNDLPDNKKNEPEALKPALQKKYDELWGGVKP